MNSHRPDVGRHPCPISPNFRTGPRQVGYDQKAEEIILFVRHFQRPNQQLGAARITPKAVLPAISGCRYRTDENSPRKDVQFHQGGFRSELNLSDTDNQTTLRAGESTRSTYKQIVVDDDGSVNEGNGIDLEDGYNNNNVETRTSPEAMGNRYISHSSESLNGFPDNRSMIRDEPQLTSTSTKPSTTSMFKSTNGMTTGTSIDFSKSMSLNYCSINTSNIGHIRQLHALPQLPPIAAHSIPSRPSAPSPSALSPSPMSDSDTEFTDENKDEDEI